MVAPHSLQGRVITRVVLPASSPGYSYPASLGPKCQRGVGATVQSLGIEANSHQEDVSKGRK